MCGTISLTLTLIYANICMLIAYHFVPVQVIWNMTNQFTFTFSTSSSTGTTAYSIEHWSKDLKGKNSGKGVMGEMEKQHQMFYPFWKKHSFVSGYRMCNSFVISPLQALYNISHCQIAVLYSPSFAGILVNNIWCLYKDVSRNHNRKHFVLVLLNSATLAN